MDPSQALTLMPWPPDPDLDATVVSYLSAYLDHLAGLGMSSHTVVGTRLDLLQLARFLGRQPLRSVGLDDLRAFFNWLSRQQGNSASSLRRKTSTVKRFFRQLRADALLDDDPAAGLVYPGSESKTRAGLAPEEVRAVLAAASDPVWRALLLCLAEAGLKRDEAVALRWEDVDPSTDALPAGRLQVRHRRSAKRVRQRTLGLSPGLGAALAVLRSDATDGADAVFGISARGVDFVVETCGKRAGVRTDSKVTPQMLRDAYACARVREFLVREAAFADRPSARVEAVREHDRLLVRELGLSATSAAPTRYRAMVERLEADRPKQRPLEDQ
jgi:site-specific recombinase XerD